MKKSAKKLDSIFAKMKSTVYLKEPPTSTTQRDRDIEKQRKGGIERQSHGEIHDTQDTDDAAPLAATVNSLPEAVALAISLGLGENCMFHLSRAIKAFEITTNHRLPAAELRTAFNQWWAAAKSLIPSDADYDEYRFDFEDTFAKTRSALGANSLEEAIHRAKSNPMPAQAGAYNSPKLKLLVAVCCQLQLLQGPSPFFLGVRDAGRILGEPNLHRASAKLAGLVRDGLMVVVVPGTRNRATRYRLTQTTTKPAD